MSRKKTSRKKRPRSRKQSEQIAKRAIAEVVLALDRHRLIFLWLAKPIPGAPGFPPELRTADKFFYDRLDSVESIHKRLGSIYLIEPELSQCEAEAKDYVLDNVDLKNPTTRMVRLERLDLQLLLESSAAIAHECLRLEMRTKNARARECASRARGVRFPADMPQWPLEDELIVPWTYLGDLEAVLDAYTTQKVPPVGRDFEFLPVAVRYRGRRLSLRNGMAKDALLELARCFDDVIAYDLLPGNKKSSKGSDAFRQAATTINRALSGSDVPCKLTCIRGKGYALGPIEE